MLEWVFHAWLAEAERLEPPFSRNRLVHRSIFDAVQSQLSVVREANRANLRQSSKKLHRVFWTRVQWQGLRSRYAHFDSVALVINPLRP